MNKNEKLMNVAINEAKKGITLSHGGPFGAVIVKDGKIIAKGHNKVVLKHDPTCHGEMEAIRKASKKLNTFDLSGCEIYTTGYPCPMCFGAILWSNINKIYYGCNTTDTELIGFRDKKFEELLDDNPDSICFELNRDKCLKLYEEYTNLKNKTNY